MKMIKFLLIGLMIFCGMAQVTALSIGDRAPSFTLKDQDGNDRSLQDFKGKFIVLYFYPKDNTPGCTKQACSLRDSFSDFEKEDVVVLGINYDSPATHKKFKEKHRLPFTLLSDSDKSVAKKYGAKNWWFIPIPYRMTFIIGPDGEVKQIMESVDVSTHTEKVLKIVREEKSKAKNVG